MPAKRQQQKRLERRQLPQQKKQLPQPIKRNNSKKSPRKRQQGQQNQANEQSEQIQQDINVQLAIYTWLQAIGTNITAIGQTKILSRSTEVQDEGQNLVVIGNIIQSIANAVQTELTLQQTPFVTNKSANNWNAFGSLLQSIGNSIQAIATEASD
ncbi:DUF6944 family repetitive protein [Paenibacillus shunpengii]|uniref:DUF6944 family repetitive protein n=1 Tax=Paenibacillus shunpengii TaxID=2054424 RepID=A0ABW5SWH6_9BACL|nr:MULTISPECIES: hypothetical protein [unclassified Paenibacillus]SDW91813.1 hypothetical protein SAMN05518848_103407 [Paenibacillus sp. PDC88]